MAIAGTAEQAKRYRERKAAEDPDWYRKRYRSVVKPWKQRVRDEAIAHYGGCCAECGIDDPLVLVLDHIHDDGAEHRRQISGGAYQIGAWLKRHGWPEGIVQVLCANCNLRKQRIGYMEQTGEWP